MTVLQKIFELKQFITDNLTPLITNDYIFLDTPYYPNIGDTLIWQGTLDFLRILPYRSLYSSSIINYQKPNIDKEIIILLQGGGNFGDLWRAHQNFRIQILESFPDNKIIMMPQSIGYTNETNLIEDAKVFNKHKKLTLCFRDKASLNIANKYFTSATNLLIPDMAFSIDMNCWEKYIKPIVKGKVLFLDRKDCEKNIHADYSIVPEIAEVHDWPTMEKRVFGICIFHRIQRLFHLIDKVFSTQLTNLFSDFVFQRILRKYYIRKGIEFISEYETIYTTRLHAGILAFMLGKAFTFFDNSYGKNRGVYETWLKDVETIKFTEK
jgi:pyruvyl transferase EpsO